MRAKPLPSETTGRLVVHNGVTWYAVGQFVHVIRKRIKLSSEKVLSSFPIRLTLPHALSGNIRLCQQRSSAYRQLPSTFPHLLGAHSHTPAAALITQIYAEHADEDGFLYITYNGENTFGSAL